MNQEQMIDTNMTFRTQAGERWMLLLKMGQKEHLEMLRKGILYMNPLSYFAALETDPARGDAYEGSDSIIQPCDIGEFTIDSHIEGLPPFHAEPSDFAGPIRIGLHRTLACNIFCLFTVNKPIDGPIFPQTHQWFGDSFVLFTNTQEFLSRVDTAAKERQLNGQRALVEYYDKAKFSGKTGRFRKQSIYSYQREYRIVLETGSDRPFRFDVGDLSDITSEVLPFELADKVLKLSSADAQEAGLILGC
jgi:hypothetical protein